jgi:hypothetical protein
MCLGYRFDAFKVEAKIIRELQARVTPKEQSQADSLANRILHPIIRVPSILFCRYPARRLNLFDRQQNPDYRAITVITLIQTGVIVYGVLTIGSIVSRSRGQVPDWFINSAALFMWNHGFSLLLIPFGWALLASALAWFQVNRWVQWIMNAVGIMAIICGLKYFSILAINPYIL